MVKPPKTILVVGASRGLGLGLVQEYLFRDWSVTATTRGSGDALRRLAATHPDRLAIAPLDVTSSGDIAALRERLAGKRLDVLFVSAGITEKSRQPAGALAAETFAAVMLTNALAPMAIIETLGGSVADDGVIVAMTSRLGSVDGNTGGGDETYRASKAALNSLLRSYAARHERRALVAMHPGWVRTDMGGSHAPIDVAESCRGMARVIDARVGQPGCLFLDYRGETIPW